ncbi:MAG: rcsC [Schlesneria sp.]|nr:rcsC [Schlesneria sp.]
MTPKPSVSVNFLLVDDLDENLLALEGLLRREGLVLLRAKSGNEALELLLNNEVALALVDVQMPGMNGFELAELMRGMERTRRVPIIFLTAGNTDRQRRFQGYEAGAVDFLQKPIESDILRSKAQVFFDLFRQRQEVAQQRDELRAATEQNLQLLKESRQHAEALREADRRKDDFLAMLAHELRNPLAPVRNAVEILRLAQTTDPSVTHARDVISRQVSHMVRLVDDLLDVARIARNKVELRLDRCDLAAIVRQTAEDYRPTLTATEINLEVDLPQEPVMLTGDATRLAQVFGNLLHNSGKFTPAGGNVHLSIERDESTKMAVVRVTDSGIGLDPKVIGQLFEPFIQADQSLDREKGGLGLGLALVRGLVELHHGTVTAESPGLGQGSTFIVRLPLTEAEESTAASAGDPSPQVTNTVKKILVIEDYKDAAKTLQLLLELLGYVVEIAFDGPSGLKTCRTFRPDVIISDLGLPGAMNGYEVARSIRNDPALSGTYLIALSGYGQEDDRKKTHDAGFDDHLVKPVELDELQQAMSRAQLEE